MATHQDIVQRARTACGMGIKYKLGKGGMSGSSASPSDSKAMCDCSGFAAWCAGLSRKTSHPFYVELNGGWLETTAIAADAIAVHGIFTKVDKPFPGCFAVFGDRNGKQGHIGVVTEVVNGKATKVIHCSSTNSRTSVAADPTKPRAIQETGADLFYKNQAVFCRLDSAQ